MNAATIGFASILSLLLPATSHASFAAMPANVGAALIATQLVNDNGDEIVPSLTVRGDAQFEKPADELQIRVGVVTESDEAPTALRENSRQMKDVIDALKKTGLSDKEYQTSRFQIQPMYTRRPRQADAAWKPKIIGYRVSNSLNVKTKKLELAGELIQAANEAGANSIDSISFGLADPRTHRVEAIRAATANALTDAHTLAEAAGLRLVRVLSITLDQAAAPRPIPMMQRMSAGMAMAEAAPPPIQPGDVTVRASVTVVYAIAEQNDAD